MSSYSSIRSSVAYAPGALATRLQQAVPSRDVRAAGRLVKAILPWIVPALLLGGWWLGAARGWISPQVLPSPALVMTTMSDSLHSGLLWSSMLISLERVAMGFLISLLVGVPLGVAMGLSPVLRDYLYPLFKIIAYVPLLGWLPLLVMMLGIGEALKFVLIAKAALVPITINTCNGVRDVPKQFLELADVYRLDRWQTLRRVVFPSAFSQIWSGVRYGIAVAWLTMVAAEYLAASEGLGYLMASGQQMAQLDLVIVAVIVVAVIGLAIDHALAFVERRLLRWQRNGR